MGRRFERMFISFNISCAPPSTAAAAEYSMDWTVDSSNSLKNKDRSLAAAKSWATIGWDECESERNNQQYDISSTSDQTTMPLCRFGNDTFPAIEVNWKSGYIICPGCFDLCPMSNAHSSFHSIISASLTAASFDLSPMPDAYSSSLGKLCASFTAASFPLCPMPDAHSSITNLICAPISRANLSDPNLFLRFRPSFFRERRLLLWRHFATTFTSSSGGGSRGGTSGR